MISLKTIIRFVIIYIQYLRIRAFRLFLWMEKSMFIQEHIWRKWMGMSL